MATLGEIQVLVDEALAKIADQEFVKTVLWPEIKRMLSDCTDLERNYRVNMIKLIHKQLNEALLQGMPAPINLERLKRDLQSGKVQVSESSEVRQWLPW